MIPCPKCDSIDIRLVVKNYDYLDYTLYCFKCKNCGWWSPEQESEEKALFLWEIFRPGRGICY